MATLLCGLVCAEIEAQDLGKYFQNTEGAFVLYDLKNDRYLRYNERRCRERFSPFSTFKIPNSLIGLETGVVKDAEFVIPWDSQKYPAQNSLMPEWNRDQTLRSAFKYSVVWYYRELAKGVGDPRMKKWVAELGYGNQDTSGGIDRFWLQSSLRISADEQIEFLKKLYREQLPASKRSIEIVKDIMTLEKTADYKLSAKTGGGPLSEGKYIGWFVGYLEAKGNVYFFAINLEGDSFASIRARRINLTKQILTDLGYLPKQ
ncbi:MAG: class D beta-lactamase [Blastocatellia bacterium]